MVRLAASDADEAILVRNLTLAYKVSDWFANNRHLDLWDVRDVVTTMLVTESGGGFIYANDGQGFQEPDTVAHRTPWNWNDQTNKPIGTPEQRAQMRAILRRSLDLPHDKVGSNGRSTGPAQQLSAETGGGWGPMAATMRMDLSVLAFLDAVDWANRSPLYLGKQMANWQTAMLLRVQRPLPSEVATNYGAAQLARAQAIARDERFAPASTDWIIDMADQAALDKFRGEIVGDILPLLRDIHERIIPTGAQWDNIQDIQGTLRSIVADDIADDAREQKIADLTADIQARILPPGASWDNIQDLQNIQIPAILAALKALSDKVDALTPKQ